MKYIMTAIICAHLASSLHADALVRLTKKDKEDLTNMLAMPISDMQKSLAEINEMAQQIQNFIFNVGSNDDAHHAKQCCYKILAHLEKVENQLSDIMDQVIMERIILGNLDDESVGEQDFNSVKDIDYAELSVISWLKTIYREQLKDKFIS